MTDKAHVIARAYEDKKTKETILQIIDLNNGKAFSGRPGSDFTVGLLQTQFTFRRLSAEKLFIVELRQDPKIFYVVTHNDQITLSPVPPTAAKSPILLYGSCVGSMSPDLYSLAVEEIKNLIDSDTYSCEKHKKTYLLNISGSRDSGGFHNVEFLYPKSDYSDDPHVEKLADQLLAMLNVKLTNNSTWIGLSADSGLTAVIVNRDIFVYSTPRVRSDYYYSFRYRLLTPPSAARFIGPRTLVVVEGRTGQVTTFDLNDYPSKAITARDFVGQDSLISTSNHGNCAGYPFPLKPSETMPDGRILRYEKPGSQSHTLDVSGNGPDVSIDLGPEDGCVSISRDWKWMLVTDSPGSSSSLTVYDFDKVLRAGSLHRADVSPAIPIKAPTAFFVGSTSDVITTDNTNKVMRWSFNAGQWSSREIYHGENVVFYAEPDASGDRLIILEQITLDNLGAGAVYSVKARQTWFELGSGNFFMATFNTDTNVGLFSPSGDVRGGWTRVSFPIIPLSKLEALCGGEPFAALPPGKTG